MELKNKYIKNAEILCSIMSLFTLKMINDNRNKE